MSSHVQGEKGILGQCPPWTADSPQNIVRMAFARAKRVINMALDKAEGEILSVSSLTYLQAITVSMLLGSGVTQFLSLLDYLVQFVKRPFQDPGTIDKHCFPHFVALHDSAVVVEEETLGK